MSAPNNNGSMFLATARRLAKVVGRLERESGPPTAPAAWERALARRDAESLERQRERERAREIIALNRIEKGW